MKKIYLLLLLTIASTSLVFAQSSKTKKADKFYDSFEYVKAADAYLKLVKKGDTDDYVFTRLANSYYFINDTKNAATYYSRVVNNEGVDAETVYNYAQSLKANGEFEASNTQMKRFAQMKPNDSRAVAFKNNPNYIPKLLEKRARYSAKEIEDLNSGYSDFGGLIVGNKFYFTSARNTSKKNYKPTKEPFYDIYEATISGTGFMGIVPVKGEVNTKYHESNPTITADGQRMYFDRNDYYENKYEKDEEGINRLNIYYAEMSPEGDWKSIQSMPFNSSEYSTGHPVLSPDGNTLYFVSDMPGTMGMTDIYKVSIDSEGNFGEPVNLGSNINTEGREYFPFIAADGTLYFASDGHLGLGGLDVFYAEASGKSFGKVTNMGAPVNSAEDDFAFKIYEDNTLGYVSSNRGDGKGDNIYIIEELEETCESTIAMKIVDADTNEPIVGARVDILDTNQNSLGTKTAGVGGNTSFVVECDQDFVVRGSHADYESGDITVSSDSETLSKTIKLRPIEQIIVEDKVVLKPIHFDFDKHNIKPQAALELDKLVQVMKKYPEMVIRAEAHTDTRGDANYNRQLSERRAQSTVQYVISKGIDEDRISGVGKGEDNPVENCGDNCTEAQHAKNRRSEFIIVKR